MSKTINSSLPKMDGAYSVKQRRFAMTIRRRVWDSIRKTSDDTGREFENGEKVDPEIYSILRRAVQTVHAKKDPLWWIANNERFSLDFLASSE